MLFSGAELAKYDRGLRTDDRRMINSKTKIMKFETASSPFLTDETRKLTAEYKEHEVESQLPILHP